MSGKFITIEGVEGAGKSTAMACVVDFLEKRDIKVIQSREPGGTILGDKVRQILLDTSNQNIHADTELLLMFAARAQHIHELILPNLEAGRWVVSDRFVDSSFAYQGGGRDLDLSRIDALSTWTLGGFLPDLTLLLDLEPSIGIRRVKNRGHLDRFESEKMFFFEKVRAVFLGRANASDRYALIDAAASIEEVETQIKQELSDFIAS